MYFIHPAATRNENPETKIQTLGRPLHRRCPNSLAGSKWIEDRRCKAELDLYKKMKKTNENKTKHELCINPDHRLNIQAKELDVQ